MPHARRPEKRRLVPEGPLDLEAARELARAIRESGRPASWVVDCRRVAVLPDAALALLAELTRAGVELLGLGAHHRRVLRYLLAEAPTPGE